MDEVTKVRIDNVEKSISEVKEDTKENTKAINEIVNKLVVVSVNLEANTKSTEKLVAVVDNIKNKPADTQEKVKIGVLSSVCTGTIMTLVNRFL